MAGAESFVFRSDSAALPEGPVAGVILCGGQSQRMGRPKEWLRLGSHTFLERVASALCAARLAPIVVVHRVGQHLPPLPPSLELCRDLQPARGPLGGLATALQHLAGRAEIGFVTSCDAPLLKPEFVQIVCRSLRPGDAAAVPRVAGRRHPLAAAYRITLGPQLQARLDGGDRRLQAVLEALPVRDLPEAMLRGSDPELESLMNINTPEDYEQLRARRSSPA